MSEAVDNAEVMLFCISLAYKESASEDPHATSQNLPCRYPFTVLLWFADCRLECQYGVSVHPTRVLQSWVWFHMIESTLDNWMQMCLLCGYLSTSSPSRYHWYALHVNFC